MPLFIIETTAESPIREFWQVEAESAQQARDKFEAGQVGAFLWDEVMGDETEREVAQVHPRADLAGTISLHNAQQEAPAMLAALRKFTSDNRADNDGNTVAFLVPVADYEAARAILSRIDGAAPPIPAAPAPSGGIEGLPEGYAMERDQDGDPILIPPANVTIFSEPGEGWLVTADYMQGRDWNSESDVIAACCDYLRSIGREG